MYYFAFGVISNEPLLDAEWISQHIQLTVNLTPLLQDQTFTGLDDSCEEKWKTGTTKAYVAITSTIILREFVG
jgi:hypothetical protein